MSQSKLKALKVADLRDILTQAAVPIGTKPNKHDLVAKVLASPAALDVYHQQHPPSARTAKKQPSPKQSLPNHSSSPTPEIDELLDSPEPSEYDSIHASATNVPPPVPAPAMDSKSVPVPPPVSDTSETISSTTPDDPPPAQPSSDVVDEELEKRKRRAARFAIPLVEPAPPKTPAKTTVASSGKKGKPSAPPTMIDGEKLRARAARFGLPAASSASANTPAKNGRKRPAPSTDAVDAEELERRKKRAERFGMGAVSTKV